MPHQQRPSALGVHDFGGRETEMPASATSLEVKAARLHHLSRMRQAQFSLPMLADQGMAVMLTLFVAGLQGRQVSEIELTRANMIPHQELDGLMDQLIQAGLVAVTDKSPGTRSIGLTPIGSARMRSYIDVLPAV